MYLKKVKNKSICWSLCFALILSVECGVAQVIIPAGTPLKVMLTKPVSSADYKIGDEVEMRVAQDEGRRGRS